MVGFRKIELSTVNNLFGGKKAVVRTVVVSENRVEVQAAITRAGRRAPFLPARLALVARGSAGAEADAA